MVTFGQMLDTHTANSAISHIATLKSARAAFVCLIRSQKS